MTANEDCGGVFGSFNPIGGEDGAGYFSYPGEAITEDMVCAYQNNSGTCNGDSGGENRNSKLFLENTAWVRSTVTIFNGVYILTCFEKRI